MEKPANFKSIRVHIDFLYLFIILITIIFFLLRQDSIIISKKKIHTTISILYCVLVRNIFTDR